MADVKWMEKKTEYDTRFNTLTTSNNIDQLVANLDAATARYISKGGLSQNSDPNVNPDYADIIRLSGEAEDLKKKYVSLNDDILKFVAPVPTLKNCTWSVKPFNAVNPVVNVVSTSQRFPFSVCNVIVLPLVITYILTANLSVISNEGCGTGIEVKYWSTGVPFVIPSGFAEPLATSVNTFVALTL